jgi:hypothetical protein
VFTKKFWLDFLDDFATSFITGLVMYLASDGDLTVAAITAAGLAVARSTLIALVPKFQRAAAESRARDGGPV